MLHNRKTRKVRGSIRDNSRNLSVRMTEEQYRRLQRYMELARLKSTAYFCRLIQEDDFKGRSPKLSHALHLCEKLLEQGKDVVCMYNLFTGWKDSTLHLMENFYFEVI